MVEEIQRARYQLGDEGSESQLSNLKFLNVQRAGF